ncbi:MAG: type II/IV secretion system protein [Flavobacteriales bacterium]|nr:type II/IV secretion system protein [Flavobacteriales bacterium]
MDEALLIDAATRNVLTPEQAWHYRVVPQHLGPEGCTLLRAGGADEAVRLELEVLLGLRVTLEPAGADAVERALATHYRRVERPGRRVDLSARTAEHLLHDLVQEARDLGSSDVHAEVYEREARVRIRIDGLLVERYRYPAADHPALVNRVKVQAGLDISEKRLPQDGRMVLDRDGRRTDVRVSVLPTLHGEKVVLRLLGQDAGDLSLADLGMDAPQLEDYRSGIARPHGLVLISGPTGSGKTTTLYATLKELNAVRRNIVTVEDPVEYTLEGVNQVPLREGIGLGFAQALRSFLRQDPDVIMLGEVRDAETAQMAVRAALTGHLVLSTVHTNSAWGTVGRLMDMGVPPYLLAATLNTSVAQRLVRTLCTTCARPEPWPTGAARPVPAEAPPATHQVPVGCPACHYTGYRGRQALYEVVAMDIDRAEQVRRGVTDGQAALAGRPVRRLADSAWALLRSGRTSLEEAHPILTSA